MEAAARSRSSLGPHHAEPYHAVRLLGGASQPELHSGDCVKAVQALASSAPHVMMRLRDATLRAAAANKVALKAEQEKDAAEKEKEDFQHELCVKRPRPEASTIEANEEMPADVSDLDLADWRRHATKWRNRSQVQLGSREDALAPRTGKNGYVDHPRLGLIRCLVYWARGSMAHAGTMVAALCVKLGISDACARPRVWYSHGLVGDPGGARLCTL